ncbi:penicillin-binding protein 2 [Piscinibacter sp. Jin2]|uniref:Peptidoglycan D,D-transpeptidase FtsI n=1 Tax=Aquariibacter lacus TaxID=2801332 RepID=A0A9X0XJV0_9BURK|nr:penicillin-binding protein 2 [Piscinibacter lacus]MBL0720830.1 penicillin-binding protein 2 [Piscinibacter lacus]
MSRTERNSPRGSAAAPWRQTAAAHVRSVRYSNSPLLASRTPPWRAKFVVLLIGLGFLGLIGRAAWIQLIHNDFYQQKGERNYARQLELPSRRGRILDRNGLLLATSVAAPTVWAIPKAMGRSAADRAARRPLAKLLGYKPEELEKRLAANDKFVYLRRRVSEDTAAAVKALKLPGVHLMTEDKRLYPEAEAAAHVVGFTDAEDRGFEGVEKTFDASLSGQDGSRRVIRNRLGEVVEAVGETLPAVDGRDLLLSVDSKIQFFAYQRLSQAVAQHGAKGGSVVVLDVQTGELLALANLPSYRPGDRARLKGEQLRNRALTDTFEPGSTMKPFIAALALERQRLRADSPIDTAPGRISITGSTISDAHPHGMLTVAEVVQKSSNVGTVKIAQTLESREMWEMFSAIGLGQKPRVEFPAAASGRLRPYRSWKPIEKATMSYGYGLSASLLQLARAYTVFARDGELIPVTLQRRNGPVAGERVFRPETARAVRDMLQQAAGPGGTAPLAQTLAYSVGGKTGTAHVQEGKGYAAKRYRAWFVGLAPIRDPRIVVAVMVEEPSKGQYYGGQVAAPVFSDVVQQSLQTLGVTPDLAVETQLIARGAGQGAVEESF